MTVKQPTSPTWLWPRNPMAGAAADGHEEIESFFGGLYAPYKVLYFSRGRVAITAILDAIGATRNHLVFIQPYSSYCVQSAVSKVATPLTIHPEESDFQIVYHNFGRKEVVDKAVYRHVVIEDSVDSLVLSNEEDELFPNKGDYAVFSLAKLLRLPFGSVVVCRTEEAYERLKGSKVRENKDGNLDQILNPLFTDGILYHNATAVPQTLSGNICGKLKAMYEETKQTVTSNVMALDALIGGGCPKTL